MIRLHFYDTEDGHIEAGPFEQVQITYDLIRTGENGDSIARLKPDGYWQHVAAPHLQFTDVVFEETDERKP